MLWRIIAMSFVLFRPTPGSHSLYYGLMLFLLYLKDDKSSPGGNRGAEKLRQWDSFCGTDKFVVYKNASANFWYPRMFLFIHAVLGLVDLRILRIYYVTKGSFLENDQ